MAKTDTGVATEKVDAAPDVHIDEFLQGVEDSDATLKHMFRHFTAVVNGVTHRTVVEFEALFEEFKKLPASKLK